jgi:cell division protein FtsI (penicillin-binding protein 3)
MAGSVFSKIAERVYAKDLRYDIKNAVDSTSNVIPSIKAGEINEALYVLNKLDIPTEKEFSEKGTYNWGYAEEKEKSILLQEKTTNDNLVPNVNGMGAKDAVFLLESRGLRVQLQGRGKVKSQSIKAGTHLVKGQTISLTLR